MMSAKLATIRLLKINKIKNKAYDIIILDYDVTNKILPLESNWIVDSWCDQSLVTLTFLWEMLS